MFTSVALCGILFTEERERKENNLPAIGQVIARLRARKGWSQGQLSLKTATRNARKPVSKAAISLLEGGHRENPHILTLARLAIALEASVDDILIEAGLLPPRAQHLMAGIQEAELLGAIRSISDPVERAELLDHFIALAKFSSRVSRITEEHLRLAAERPEDYEVKKEEDGATDHNHSLSDP